MQLLAQKRHEEILNRINAKGMVRTVELASELDVTDETIRRDLQLLEESGQVKRIHGGAMRTGERPKTLAFDEREMINVEAKRQIAQAALSLIEDGDTIAFDSSTTAFELVSRLPDLNLRVLSNAHHVIGTLINKPNVDLICFGGRYHAKTRTFTGRDSLNALKHYNINKVFISCNGLDLARGASEVYEEQAAYKDILITACEQVHLMVDHTKFGKRADFIFADLNHITSVITDREADPKFIDSIKSAGISVTQAS